MTGQFGDHHAIKYVCLVEAKGWDGLLGLSVGILVGDLGMASVRPH